MEPIIIQNWMSPCMGCTLPIYFALHQWYKQLTIYAQMAPRLLYYKSPSLRRWAKIFGINLHRRHTSVSTHLGRKIFPGLVSTGTRSGLSTPGPNLLQDPIYSRTQSPPGPNLFQDPIYSRTQSIPGPNPEGFSINFCYPNFISNNKKKSTNQNA